jgi:hypothetical protein
MSGEFDEDKLSWASNAAITPMTAVAGTPTTRLSTSLRPRPQATINANFTDVSAKINAILTGVARRRHHLDRLKGRSINGKRRGGLPDPRSASDVLASSERDSVGVVRILSDDAGTPGAEREYKSGDEVLVERGQAEWVVAPVHLPSAGRRLDGRAEVEATPDDGVEVYPPAEPTSAARRTEARREGIVDAHTAEGLSADLAEARVGTARDDGDAKLQGQLGGRGVRSGPVTSGSDLPADQPVEGSDADDKSAKKTATPKK